MTTLPYRPRIFARQEGTIPQDELSFNAALPNETHSVVSLPGFSLDNELNTLLVLRSDLDPVPLPIESRFLPAEGTHDPSLPFSFSGEQSLTPKEIARLAGFWMRKPDMFGIGYSAAEIERMRHTPGMLGIDVYAAETMRTTMLPWAFAAAIAVQWTRRSLSSTFTRQGTTYTTRIRRGPKQRYKPEKYSWQMLIDLEVDGVPIVCLPMYSIEHPGMRRDEFSEAISMSPYGEWHSPDG